MDLKGQEMSVGNAGKIAAQLTSISIQHGIEPEALVDLWADIHGKVSARLIETTDALTADTRAAALPTAFNAEASVVAAFPGTTVVQAQPAPQVVPNNVVAFPGTPVAAAPAPAPIPGVAPQGEGDPTVALAWNQFFADLANGTWTDHWEDIRPVKAAGKMKPNGPDFKHKSWKPNPGDKYPVSLWINDKNNPADIQVRLAAVGIR